MATGIATIDFAGNSQRAVTTVSGQAALASNSHVEAWLMGDSTAEHNAYEHEMAAFMVRFVCDNIIAGSSFDIVAVSLEYRLTGTFAVHWVWV